MVFWPADQLCSTFWIITELGNLEAWLVASVDFCIIWGPGGHKHQQQEMNEGCANTALAFPMSSWPTTAAASAMASSYLACSHLPNCICRLVCPAAAATLLWLPYCCHGGCHNKHLCYQLAAIHSSCLPRHSTLAFLVFLKSVKWINPLMFVKCYVLCGCEI